MMASGSQPHEGNSHTGSSPTLSRTSFSPFSELTYRSSSSNDHPKVFDESEEDEVLWTGNEHDSEDDFILVPQSRPAPVMLDTGAPLVELSSLSLADAARPTTPTQSSNVGPNPKPVGKGRRSATRRCAAGIPAVVSIKSRRCRGNRDTTAAASYPSPSSSPSPVREDTEIPIFEPGGRKFGECLVVEDIDSGGPVIRDYEDAVRYISAFLASPTGAHSCSACARLKFLQSLIIELGLRKPTSVLPSTLSAAKRFLKAHAFINISTYLSVRGQGLEQLRSVMFNSRRELATDLRRRHGAPKADKRWVKQHDLTVLLVLVF